MASPHDQPPQKDHIDAMLLTVALGLLVGYTACFTSFMRSRMGSLYLGTSFLGGLSVQFLFCVYYPLEDLPLFSLVFMAVLVWHKIRLTADNARGLFEHRQFAGYPVLARHIPLLGRLGDTFGKCVIEPGLVFLISLGLRELSPGMAAFFAWGSLAMWVRANLERAFANEQQARLRDASIRNRSMAGDYRRFR